MGRLGSSFKKRGYNKKKKRKQFSGVIYLLFYHRLPESFLWLDSVRHLCVTMFCLIIFTKFILLIANTILALNINYLVNRETKHVYSEF